MPADVGVVLGDSMGEMLAYYAAADLAFVGGSLLPLGGQNLIEPLAVGTPVLIGPHTFNFSEATAGRGRRRRGAARRRCRCAASHAVSRLLSDPSRRDAMRERARPLSRRASRRRAIVCGEWLAPQLDAAMRRREALSRADRG